VVKTLKHDRYLESLCDTIRSDYDEIFTNVEFFSKKKRKIAEIDILAVKENKYYVYEVKSKDVTYVVDGKKIGIISDTRICNGCMKIAKDKDLLISDSTFSAKEEEKAHEYFHMTSVQAAEIAANANAKKLVLTHFSQRYKNVDDLVKEAQDIFPETVAAHDFLKIKI